MEIDTTHFNSKEVKFPQKKAIINYGDATVTTYNLVNCIAIGGRFNDKANMPGIFFTHESPTDKIIQKKKLEKIKDILKDTVISNIFIFRIDPSQASKNIYSNGSNTEKIIAEMIDFTRGIFGIEPTILNYMCDIKTFRCGKASISVSSVATNLEIITNNSSNLRETNNSREIFQPNYLKNKYGDLIIECPSCKYLSGNTLILTHRYDCPNKNKKPDLSNKPENGGRRSNTRKSRKIKKIVKRHYRTKSRTNY